jgi:hypothetical protein
VIQKCYRGWNVTVVKHYGSIVRWFGYRWVEQVTLAYDLRSWGFELSYEWQDNGRPYFHAQFLCAYLMVEL